MRSRPPSISGASTDRGGGRPASRGLPTLVDAALPRGRHLRPGGHLKWVQALSARRLRAGLSGRRGPRRDLVVFRRNAASSRPLYDSYPSASAQHTVTVVRTHDDLAKVMSIRSAVYMAEQVCPYQEEFDGNDFAATHLLGYVGDEPAASIRIRCFADFAKVERLAVRHEHRKSRSP